MSCDSSTRTVLYSPSKSQSYIIFFVSTMFTPDALRSGTCRTHTHDTHTCHSYTPPRLGSHTHTFIHIHIHTLTCSTLPRASRTHTVLSYSTLRDLLLRIDALMLVASGLILSHIPLIPQYLIFFFFCCLSHHVRLTISLI